MEDEGFNPNEHLLSLKGKNYLAVQWRLVWFWDRNKTGQIITEMVEHSESHAVFKASIVDEQHNTATGWGSETKSDFADYMEKAETKAIGRALAVLGYGTQFAQELDEGGSVADSPVEPKGNAHNKPADDYPDFDKPHGNGNGHGPASDENILSDKQMKFIYVLTKQNEMEGDPNDVTMQRYGCRISDLSKANAKDFIDFLQGGEGYDPDAKVTEQDLIDLTDMAKETWGPEALARAELKKVLDRVMKSGKPQDMTMRQLNAAKAEIGKARKALDNVKSARI